MIRVSTNQVYWRGLDNMMRQLGTVSKYQEQISSQKRLQSPSDDPLAASEIVLMKQRVQSSEQLQRNKDSTETALSYEENLISNSISVLQRVREIQVQSGNAIYSDSNRQVMGAETQILLAQLLDLANSKDSNGFYLFSGSKTLTQPFSIDSTGEYVYNGDETQRFQFVGNSLKVPMNDTGAGLYMRIPSGNGSFSVNENVPPNTGTVSATTGSIVDADSYVADDYQISFDLNTLGQMVYMVTGTVSGNVIPATGNVDDAPLYESGESVSFNGLSITFTGTPVAGDGFIIQPSSSESIFSTLTRMVANLGRISENPTARASIVTEDNQILQQIDNAINNLIDSQAQIGARLNQLQIVGNVNEDIIYNSQSALSPLEDANLYEVSSQYSIQFTYLQAAQASFMKILSLDIFR